MTERQRSYFLLPLFFGNGFVEDVVFLLHQSMAPETVFAAAQIGTKPAFGAVIAIFTEEAAVAIAAADAFVTEFTTGHSQTIAAVFACIDAAGVVAIFVLLGLCDEIAVFGFAAAICVFRIHVHPRVDECAEVGGCIHQFVELSKERSIEIEVPCIVFRIPLIAQPFADVVDGERCIRWVH